MLMLGAGSVLAGTGAAALHGNLEILAAILCMLFAMFAQLSSGFYHRYYDAIYNYGEFFAVSGRKGDDSPAELAGLLKAGGTAMFLIAATVGLAIFGLAGWWTLLIGAVAFFIAWINNSGPCPLFRTPYGMAVPFILFGPLGVVGTMMVQADVTPGDVWQFYYFMPGIAVGIAAGFLAANVQLVLGFMHYDRDVDNCKDTFVVRHGKRAAVSLIVFNGAMAFVSVGAYVFLYDERSPVMMIFPGLIAFAGSVSTALLMRYDRREVNGLIMQLSLWNMLIFGVLILVAGVALGDADRMGMP